MKDGERFEKEVGDELRRRFHGCVLSNVPVFCPSVGETWTRGNEIDHLLHFTGDVEDHLIIVECKAIEVHGQTEKAPPSESGPWNVFRFKEGFDGLKRMDVKVQLRNQALALAAYLKSATSAKRLVIDCWLVCSKYGGPRLRFQPHKRIHYQLLGRTDAWKEIANLSEQLCPVRINQSAYLGELSRGLALPDIGHPDLPNALAHVFNCRNAIDDEVFRCFNPTKGQWAVNGTAGMGKSVLLAYALYVVSTNKQVVPASDSSERMLKDFSEEATKIELPEHEKRVICAVACKEKQIRVLEATWNRFIEEFSFLDNSVNIRINRPRFKIWNGQIASDWNVLFIDEAHDLDDAHQSVVARWRQDEGHQRYLAIACDRHQKIRLVGPKAKLIEGLDFSGKARKLSRNYRNPFPVYATSLALMFRWFAAGGVKIMPTPKQLQDEFSLDVKEFEQKPEGKVVLQSWNDSHPANYWNYTTASFPSCDAAFAKLKSFHLHRDQILWLRFGKEEEFFNYEALSEAFTYHNCCTPESCDLVNKYVKGQEFPVVVIEGFPDGFDRPVERNSEMDDDEMEMWRKRRELYLCCSRATCFLYFVYQGKDYPELRDEMRELLKWLSEPRNPNEVTKITWQLEFGWPDVLRRPDTFDFDEPREPQSVPPQPIEKKITVPSPVTIKALANLLGLQPSQVGDILIPYDITEVYNIHTAVPDDIARKAVLQRGYVLEIIPGETDKCPAPPAPLPVMNIEIPSSRGPWTELKVDISSGANATTIHESSAAATLLKAMEHLWSQYGEIVLEEAQKVPSGHGRGALVTDDPADYDYRHRDGSFGQYQSKRIPGTKFFLFTNSTNKEKKDQLIELAKRLRYRGCDLRLDVEVV